MTSRSLEPGRPDRRQPRVLFVGYQALIERLGKTIPTVVPDDNARQGILPSEAQFDRYWRFTLFGMYLQDEYRVSPTITLNAALRYEITTMPEDIYGRDSALPDLSAPAPTVGSSTRTRPTRACHRAPGSRGISSPTGPRQCAGATAFTSTPTIIRT